MISVEGYFNVLKMQEYLNKLLLIILINVFQNISRLTIERLAYCIESGETDRPGSLRFQHGKIRHCKANLLGKFCERHFSSCHHYIQVNSYHKITSHG